MPQMEQRVERGDLRIIFTDGLGMEGWQQKHGDDVWALVGPIGQHTSHPELQDALGLVCMAFNRRTGRLSAEKHAELVKGNEAGAALIAEALAATRPTPDGEIGELVKRLRAPAYWMSGSSDGHEGDNYTPLDAATALETQAADIARLREAGGKDKARYLWLANAVLYCDYGDNDLGNPASPERIGWGVQLSRRNSEPFIFGQSIDAAIDAALATKTASKD